MRNNIMAYSKKVIKIESNKEGVIFENYFITQRIDGTKIGILMIMVKGKKEGPSY